jgi:hypothetical protein
VYGRVFLYRGGVRMKKAPIASVTPMQDRILQVNFNTGNTALVDLKPRLGLIRFRALTIPEIWDSADTDGGFVHWYRDGIAVVELSYDEMLSMMVGETYY